MEEEEIESQEGNKLVRFPKDACLPRRPRISAPVVLAKKHTAYSQNSQTAAEPARLLLKIRWRILP